MSASKESLDEQDPDYVSSAPSDAEQQKLYEENGKVWQTMYNTSVTFHFTYAPFYLFLH